MADKKISELVSLTGANAATGDLLPIVDISATETKKITRDEFFKNIPSVDVTGNITVGGNLTVDTNVLFVNAANNTVGIGTNTPAYGVETRGRNVGLTDGSLIMESSQGESLTLRTNVNNGNDDEIIFVKTRSSGQITAGDFLGTIRFNGHNESAIVNSASIECRAGGNTGFLNGRLIHNATEHRLNTQGITRFSLANNGNVGIGVLEPQALLEVAGKSMFRAASGSGTMSIVANTNSTNAGNKIAFFAASRWEEGEEMAFIQPRFVSNNGGAGNVQRGHLTFGTSGAERMRIGEAGDLHVGKTSPTIATAGVTLYGAGAVEMTYAGAPLSINRLVNDGPLVQFFQEGTLEGNISVSGTTVSYNGGHLARWSQTADNTRIDLLKGTVMTNLDQMAVWGDEDNEQLNCMSVSSAEGDPNVAGVFVNWDNDDDDEYTNDMNIAMTGDMIIRVAQGTTIQRGDLLMSAGDGTAKPQGDDIIRSKTIAKVTSTHVTCTYEDGSYCVPCVLMAC